MLTVLGLFGCDLDVAHWGWWGRDCSSACALCMVGRDNVIEVLTCVLSSVVKTSLCVTMFVQFAEGTVACDVPSGLDLL